MPLGEKRARLQRQRTLHRLDSTTSSYHRMVSRESSIRLNYYRSLSVLSTAEQVSYIYTACRYANLDLKHDNKLLWIYTLISSSSIHRILCHVLFWSASCHRNIMVKWTAPLQGPFFVHSSLDFARNLLIHWVFAAVNRIWEDIYKMSCISGKESNS